jgi:uroporphyrin-III C-methyltransferase/precorrin-2 dehydrogenase/sirohydrochlorin ferrochelatase
VPGEILELARRDAERIYVGKQAGNHHRSQQEIHEIMLKEACKGRTVVRLKGGDPFVFGRGGEELEWLRSHGVEYEVVPGITAAIGCAAYAGIPLTHRDHAQALTFVTGHLSSGTAPDAIDWSAIAGPGRTTVVYMGVGQAGTIREKLIDAGISEHLPTALITDGTRDSQQHIEGTVGSLPSMARNAALNAPGLLIIGQVAGLGGNLAWFRQNSPLSKAA